MTADQKTENTENKLVFPDLNAVLCPKEIISLDEAQQEYRKILLATKITYNIKYANKLLEYQKLMLPKNLNSLNKDYAQYQKHIQQWMKKKGYYFNIIIQKRRKSYKKYHEKIRLFSQTQNDLLVSQAPIEEIEKYSLERIRDAIGIRIIPCLGNVDTHKTVSICYEILNETIRFFTIIKGYNPFIAEPKLYLGFEPNKNPDIIVPADEEAVVLAGFKNNVKDYYKVPKKNGYQSLHIAFNSLYGIPIEIQIRTFATHLRVEYISAHHEGYDKERYPERLILDRPNINVHGYFYMDGLIEDFIGLEKAIDPFSILY